MKPAKDKQSKIGQINIPEIQGLNLEIEKNMKVLNLLHKDTDAMQNSLDKKRQKQHDHNIP